MPTKTTQPSATRGLFSDRETLSFALEKSEASAVKVKAARRGIPFSQWLREAAREKLAREKEQAA